MALKLQQDCDMAKPEEHALWALTGLAGPSSHAPLIVPEAAKKKWAKQIYDAGFRHHPELQTIKYVPPRGNVDWVHGAAGRWVPVDEVLPPEDTAPDTSHLDHAEKLIMFQRLAAELFPQAPTGDTDIAKVNN